MKGAFITIYGINNIGKSTQAKRLVESLNQKGYNAIFLKYPLYDLEPTGPEINSILRSNFVEQTVSEKKLQTLFMQNRKDYEKTLIKMIDEEMIIIAEDYAQTGIAWGTAKGLDEEWVEELNSDLLKEDFAILMVGTRSLHARESNHIHETNDKLVQKVGEVLKKRASKMGWKIVEVQPEKADTANLMLDAVENFLSSRTKD